MDFIFENELLPQRQRLDRNLGFLLLLQWATAIFLSRSISPYEAVGLGALLSLPGYLIALKQPGRFQTRCTLGVSQVLFSTLLMQLSGDRLNFQFHLFTSLALISLYRDRAVLAVAAVVAILGQLFQGHWIDSVWLSIEFTCLYTSVVHYLESIKHLQKVEEKLGAELERKNQAVNEVTNSLAKANVRLVNQQKSLIASSKLTALGEMAGAIAHEINNPITIINGFTNQIRNEIKKDSPSQEKMLENLERISAACIRITKIVSSLRTVSRDGSHDKFEPMLITELLEETLPLCSEKFKNHGIELIIEPYPSDLAVPCQRISISQVLLNLLNNAHDAIENIEPKWIRLSVREINDSIEFSVTDSGKEIPKHVKDKLMTPFFTTKPVGKGTGLGLSIAKGLIEQHQGKLFLDMNSPHTRFVFTIPKNKESRQGIPQAA